MYGDLLLDRLGVNFLGPASLDLELLHMLTTFHWNALGSTLGWWCCHNNTVSCNEKFWVEHVTVPHPPPSGEGQGVGKDKGGGGVQATPALGSPAGQCHRSQWSTGSRAVPGAGRAYARGRHRDIRGWVLSSGVGRVAREMRLAASAPVKVWCSEGFAMLQPGPELLLFPGLWVECSPHALDRTATAVPGTATVVMATAQTNATWSARSEAGLCLEQRRHGHRPLVPTTPASQPCHLKCVTTRNGEREHDGQTGRQCSNKAVVAHGRGGGAGIHIFRRFWERFRTARVQRQSLRCLSREHPLQTTPPTEACMIHSNQHRGCRMQDPGTRGYQGW